MISLENYSKSPFQNRAIKPIKVQGEVSKLQKELYDIETQIDKLNSIQKIYRTEGERYIIIGEIKNSYENLLKQEKVKPIDSIDLNQLNDEKNNLEKNLKKYR